LLILKEGSVHDEDQLYAFAKDLPWEKYLQREQTFAISPTISSHNFSHSGFAALRVKDGIADHFRDVYGRRPDVDKDDPDIPVNIHIFRTNATLSLNTSGPPLFQRGYKEMSGKAPMNEVLAAGLIALSGWDGKSTFYDPMCGTGTLALEAAMKAKGIPAQKFRDDFAFENFYFMQLSGFKKLKRETAKSKQTPMPEIFASDQESEAIRLTKKNAFNLKMQTEINIENSDFFKKPAPAPSGTLIMNPPYSERMQLDAAKEFYQRIGDKFKESYQGWKCWVISANLEGIKHLGLKPFQKHTVYNGKLECSFRGYDIY
jgi:putative N6-adenine-specific DNA methylase